MQRVISFLLVTTSLPLLVLISLIILIDSGLPILFTQKRAGKNKRPFKIFKFRTMNREAQYEQKKYKSLNEADGPVFKIRNDPRFTRFGIHLAKSGLDELPQLINIVKGEMNFVGPRPLPINEARNVPAIYTGRFSVLPGITSSWVIQGTHAVSFTKWMKLDLDYINKRSKWLDLKIVIQTIHVVIKAFL